MSISLPLRLLTVAAPLALAACSAEDSAAENLNQLDAELVNTTTVDQPDRDPAVLAALRDQIMVDPRLVQQANADALRPADRPFAAPLPPELIGATGAPVPAGPLLKAPDAKPACPACDTADQAVTLGGLAQRQKSGGIARCVGGLSYAAGWAARMPDGLALYPQSRLVEAAGNDSDGCALRAATFATTAGVPMVLDWYFTRATGAGYRSEQQARSDGEHALIGTRQRDGAAFALFVRPRDGGGTEVDLVADRGR